MSLEGEVRSGRPSTSQNEEVIEKFRQIVMEDRCRTLREIANTHLKAKQSILEILRRLRDAVQSKWPDMCTGKNWQLYHDNAPAYSTHVMKYFLTKNNTTLVRQPPCSPDLVPCNFWLFPKLKTTLKGKRFQSRHKIMKKSDGGAHKQYRG